MKKLNRIGVKFKTDKSTLDHCYLDIYERYFSHLENAELSFLEIGVERGCSLRTWNEYFKNSKVKLYGVDNNKKCSIKVDRCKLFFGDQEDRSFLRSIVDKAGPFDIIIDDGGHTMGQQQVSFGFLFKYVKSGGFYVIEDLHTSYQRPSLYNTTNTKKTTLWMLQNLNDSGKVESDFMSPEEMTFINSNHKYCNVEKGKKEIAFVCKK